MADYKETRYCDLKAIVEAMVSYYPPEVVAENVSYQALEAEFNWLAEDLGYEDLAKMLERLIRNFDNEQDEQ
jgi:hypothetical protein